MLATLAVASCGGPDPSETWTGDRCALRIHAMRQKVEAAAREPGPVVAEQPMIELPSMASGAEPSVGPGLTIAAREWRLDGQVTGSDATSSLEPIRAHLAILDENWAILHPSGAPRHRLLVQADRRVKMEQLRHLQSNLAGWRILILGRAAAQPPSNLPAERPALVARQFDHPNGRDTPEITAEAMTEALGTCDVRDAMARVAAAGAASTTTVMADALPTALSRCNCRADVDSIEYLMLLMLAPGPRYVVRELTAPNERLPDTMTVDDWVRAR